MSQRNSQNTWSLTVQMTGTARSSSGHLSATGELTLTEPNGTAHRFPMRSGGFGRYGDHSMLPGLEADLTPHDPSSNARYGLNWKNFSPHLRGIRPDMRGPDGQGSWLAITSLNTTRSHFGIHTDGPNNARSHAGDGTHGCIGLEPAVADAFFDQLLRIPVRERPAVLEVLPPALSRTALSAGPADHAQLLSPLPTPGARMMRRGVA